MNVWDLLKGLFEPLVDAVEPIMSYEFGGFTLWQYSLFMFLFSFVVRFIFPLVGGVNVSGFGSIISDRSDTVKRSQSSAYDGKGVYKH